MWLNKKWYSLFFLNIFFSFVLCLTFIRTVISFLFLKKSPHIKWPKCKCILKLNSKVKFSVVKIGLYLHYFVHSNNQTQYKSFLLNKSLWKNFNRNTIIHSISLNLRWCNLIIRPTSTTFRFHNYYVTFIIVIEPSCQRLCKSVSISVSTLLVSSRTIRRESGQHPA